MAAASRWLAAGAVLLSFVRPAEAQTLVFRGETVLPMTEER